jgi:hypothetical protein
MDPTSGGDDMRVSLWASVGLLVAVGAVPGQVQEKKPVENSSDFYPLATGYQWRYRVTVNEAPPQKVVITAEKPEVYEYKSGVDKKEGSESIVRYPLRIVSGQKERELVEHVAVLKDGVYRFATAGKEIMPPKEITPPLCFLKLPVKAGESWNVEATSENVPLKGTFTCTVEQVKVPAGEFGQALHVSSPDFQVGTEKMALDYWFAKGLGIVKQQVHVGNSKVLMELEVFKKGK